MKIDKISNVKLKDGFDQVCVWPGMGSLDNQVGLVEEFFLKTMDIRVQCLEQIITLPDTDENGNSVENSGGRSDLFFAVHIDDTYSFAIPRLQMGIRWIEDVLSSNNYLCKIYPERVIDYCAWCGDE